MKFSELYLVMYWLMGALFLVGCATKKHEVIVGAGALFLILLYPSIKVCGFETCFKIPEPRLFPTEPKAIKRARTAAVIAVLCNLRREVAKAHQDKVSIYQQRTEMAIQKPPPSLAPLQKLLGQVYVAEIANDIALRDYKTAAAAARWTLVVWKPPPVSFILSPRKPRLINSQL